MTDDTRILVVDDEPDIRSMVRLVLELEGYQVIEAGSGEQALELLMEARPDVLLLDIRLPGIDGWEVLDRIGDAPQEPRPGVVIISAHNTATAPARAAELGCDFLAKPFTPDDLTKAIIKSLN